MARDLRNRIRKCCRCKKFEAAPPVAPLRPLTCSGPGELLHVDFTSIEETVPLQEEPVIRNVMVMQDHFSKYVVAYVVKDQMACTTAETLGNGYFGLFGAPAYLVSDQGKAFTGHLISNLCELYGVYVMPPQSWGDRSDTKHSKCLLLGGRRLNQLTLIPKPKGSGGARAAMAQVGPANKRNDTKRCLPIEASLRPGEAIPW